jgi:hypothetical protein
MIRGYIELFDELPLGGSWVAASILMDRWLKVNPTKKIIHLCVRPDHKSILSNSAICFIWEESV